MLFVSLQWQLLVHSMVTLTELYYYMFYCCVTCMIDPFAHYTHWKQTVFYMDDFITIKKGEEVNGVFHLKPNQRNIVRTGISIFAFTIFTS